VGKLVEATHVSLGAGIGLPDAWAQAYLDEHGRLKPTVLPPASRRSKATRVPPSRSAGRAVAAR
jgi:hypothetical protein